MTKYEQIQNDIIDKIERGIYRADDKIPSENELVKSWNVSRITVTKALTELSLGGYIYRVQGKGSFVCPLDSHISSNSIRNIKKDRTVRSVKKIGVILPGQSDTHAGKLLDGILDVFCFPKYFVNTVFCKNEESETYALSNFFEDDYDGVILYPVDFEMYSDVILKMKLSKYPLVLVDRKFPGIDCSYVIGNNITGCELAVNHLYLQNHRNIAFVSSTDYREQVSGKRFKAYSQSMQSRSLDVCDFHKMFADKEAVKTFITRVKSKDITAVITCNVSALVQLSKLCDKENILIPQDLSVVTFDNPNTENITYCNFFTFIDQKSYKMGVDSANILKDIIENNCDGKQFEIQPELVIHKSTKNITP